MTCYILLHAASSNCTMELLIGLLMTLIPALLGWLMAQSYYKVPDLRASNAKLGEENTALGAKVSSLTGDNTDLRVKITQMEAEIGHKDELITKQRNDVIIAESERNILKIKLEECMAGAGVAAAGAAGIAAAGAAPAPPPEPRFITFAGTKYRWDDLKIVEGIGPKIAELFNNAGIHTWKELSETSVDRLKEILDAAGPNYQIHDPSTWPQQAKLAHEEQWEALKTYQDELNAGRA